MKSQEKKYRHAGHVSSRRVEEEVVILDMNTSAYFTLNEVGALIWERLGAGDTLAAARKAVCGRYKVDAGVAMKHAEKLLKDLLAKGLLQPAA